MIVCFIDITDGDYAASTKINKGLYRGPCEKKKNKRRIKGVIGQRASGTDNPQTDNSVSQADCLIFRGFVRPQLMVSLVVGLVR